LAENYIFFIIIFLISFALVAAATPMVSRVAVINKIIDHPGLHKTHLDPKPLLGGLALFFGFALTILLFLDLDEKIITLGTATVILLVTGLLDDIYDIHPFFKLTGQTVAASIVVLGNIYLYRFMLDYFSHFNIPEYIVLGLLIGWVVLIINAFNLIDGLDGLAVGTAAIIFLAMTVLSIITGGNPNIIGVQLIGLGACSGFLLYNFNPAKIFMGDSGSMLLGFILATTHLFTIKYPFSAALVLGSIFIFAYPALDIAFAIYRRLFNRRSIFKADKGHIHHVLMSLGFSVRKTVLIIYLANVIFAILAVLLLSLDISPLFQMIIGILTALFVILLFRKLTLISLRNGVTQD